MNPLLIAMEIVQKIRKGIFKKLFIRQANEKYIATPARKTVLQPMKTNFLLVTLSFNDFELIKLQKASLKKITDAYDHIIADNSSNDEQATSIEKFCTQEGVGYVRLPQPNPGSKFDRSLSHGFSLNWIFYNVVKKLNPERFGFLESDVLVAASGSFLAPWQGKLFWGMKGPSQSPELSAEQQEKTWRLWPGFCFFKRDFYQGNLLNFLPVKYIDTGGGNFKFLKDLPTDHLIPWTAVVDRKISEESPETVQAFANVVHLVGMSIPSDEFWDRNKKWKFARAIVFGS